jgi:hypothetical protein
MKSIFPSLPPVTFLNPIPNMTGKLDGVPMKGATVGLVLFLASVALAQNMESSPEKLNWLSWSDDVFVQAKREHRFVLLDLEAVWCPVL